MDTFEEFIVNLKHLRTAYVNFDKKQWLDFTDILAECSVDHLEHYITLAFKKTYYTQHIANKLLSSSLFGSVSDDKLQKKQLDESKVLLNEIIFEMKRKFTQLEAIMFKRSDVCARRCEYDRNAPRILITLKLKEKYRVVMDTSRAGCLLRFKVDLALADDAENLVIPIPHSAPANYSHDGWLTTRKREEEEEMAFELNRTSFEKTLNVDLSHLNYHKSSVMNEAFVNHSESVQKFNDVNGLGSRTTNTNRSRRKDYQAPGSSPHCSSSSNDVKDQGTTTSCIERSGCGEMTFRSLPGSVEQTSCHRSLSAAGIHDESSGSLNTTRESPQTSSYNDTSFMSPISGAFSDSIDVRAWDLESSISTSNNNKSSCFNPLTADSPDEQQISSVLTPPADQASHSTCNSSSVDFAEPSILILSSTDVLKDVSPNATAISPFDKQSICRQDNTKPKLDTSQTAVVNRKYTSALLQTEISSSEEEETEFRRPKLKKKKFISDDDFFCNDGEYEDTHPLEAFKTEISLHHKHKTKTLSKATKKDDDAEYRSSSDEELLRFKARRKVQLLDDEVAPKDEFPTIKRSSKSKNLLKDQFADNNTNTHQKTKADTSHSKKASPQVADSKGSATNRNVSANKSNNIVHVGSEVTFAQVLKDSTLKKRNRDEFKDNPTEDAVVFLNNATRCVDPSVGTAVPAEISSQELRSINRKVDTDFILFLVKHCTTRIGAEIGLERCVMDYIFKKQELNRLTKTEQQCVSNRQEIFLGIEKLVIGTIKHERNFDHDVLERAHQRTKNLLHQNFLKQRHYIEQNESIIEEDAYAKVEELKTRHSQSSAKLVAIANKTKLFNEQSYRYSLRKVNSTLHNVCIKVCMMWPEQNNALHLLDPSMLTTYSRRLTQDSTTLQQISNVTQNGFFVMGAEDMLELVDGVSELPTSEALQTEQDELQKILNGDHVSKLLTTIESINDNEENVLKLVNIMWGKEPRIKLSYSIVKPKKKEDEELTSAGAVNTAAVTSATLVGMSASGDSVGLNSSGGVAVIPSLVPTSLATAAIGSMKITSFYGSDGGVRTSPIPATESATSVELPDKTVPPLLDKHGTAFKIALSFDSILMQCTAVVISFSDTMCLQMTIKSRQSQSLLKRLKLLRFFLSNKRTNPQSVLSLLKQNSEWYDVFECILLMKCDNVNSCNTKSDGYCMTRGIYQLKCQEDNDFLLSLNQMRDIDDRCNSAKSDNTNDAFRVFVSDLPNLLKEESVNASLIGVIGELKWFTFKAKLRAMELLLYLRPSGEPLEEMFWGDAQTLTMLGFNITCVSSLVGDDFGDLIKTSRNKWVKFECSSVPVARSMESWKQSATTLSDIDSVFDQELNLLLYRKPHFSVCTRSSTPPKCTEEFLSLKLDFVKQMLERVSLSEEITPDILQQLDNVIAKCEMQSQTIEYDYFDTVQFSQLLHKRFPDSQSKTGATFDFSAGDANGTDETKEMFLLRRALDLSSTKLKVMEDYNAVIYSECIKSFKRL